MPETEALMQKLFNQRSFKLERISPTTAPIDVISRCQLSDTEKNALVSLIKKGSAFRCRVGRGKFRYGETATQAIRLAIDEFEDL